MFRKAILLACVAACAAPASALAQDAEAGTARRKFVPADFTQYAPRTALDMVRQIPGFSIREGDEERGLGQVDTNVLINGERVSGKSNGPVQALSRIPAGDVVRLEIVDGASLDLAGLSGQVLNLVTQSAGGISGQFRYSPQFRSEGTPFRWGNGEISISGGDARSEWTVSFLNDQYRSGNAGPEFVYDGNGTLIDERYESTNFNGDEPQLSGSYGLRRENGDILNLTGEVAGYIYRGNEDSFRSNPDETDRTRFLREREDEFRYEVGGDYQFGLAGGRLKLIGLRRYENSPFVNSVDFIYADGSPQTGTRFSRQANEAETIARGEFTWNMLTGDWQLSAEGANNILDIDSTLEQRDELGELQPVPFPGATSRVEENRAETTLSYSRPLVPDVQFQASLGAEYSKIKQSGEFGLTRDFVRPKGFVAADWDVNPGLDLSMKLERAVGQLDFFDFIASVNVSTEQVDVVNANLVPPQSWLLEVEGTQSLGAFGSITARVYGEDITDIVDQIPIEGGGEAPGNIDSATRYGGNVTATFLSEPLGWPGTKLDIQAEINESDVDDPLLGTPRRISNETFTDVDIELRHDFASSDWAFGGNLYYEEQNPEVRLNQIVTFKNRFAFGEIFVENKDVYGLTVTAYVANVLNRAEDLSRIVYTDRQADVIAYSEDRFRNFGTIFTLSVEGSF